jgi:3-phenylpropionate/trans-cinnamate dioxygenase ferredoxin component
VSDGFVKAGRVGDLAPGRMMRVEVAGRRILLANVDGRFYATADTCTHEDASLSGGSLRGEFVKCPLHGSRFSVRTGQVMEEPAQEDLKTYPVRVEGEYILVALTESGTR